MYLHKLQEPAVTGNELLYFADICAGPGGFSEYVLWRKKWDSKGFGFTLRGPNDFKLEDFFAGPPETFEPYYGKFLSNFLKFELKKIDYFTKRKINIALTAVSFFKKLFL